MRAKAGDPPRTMPQKILAGRAEDSRLEEELVDVRVDQVILAREPNDILRETQQMDVRSTPVETAVAYDTRCVTRGEPAELALECPEQVRRDATEAGVVVARAGSGFPAAVHLERFAAPARLAITDDPRLAATGGAGMLTLLGSRSQIVGALRDGRVRVRPPRSVQVLLSGRLRSFVGVRDLALEALRRGLKEVIQGIDQNHGSPVVVEFGGPSARLLSVPERALLCSLAPRLGAIAGVFVSDEKTEVYLRDQRRSKAFRAIAPDPGAPCDEVVTLDLSAIDPLLMDAEGTVRPVRDLEGQPVSQAVLGGDTGVPLKEMLAAASLLKSKRVPPDLNFLLASGSRQTLEVLAQSGALVDLIATGARLVEPDHRLLSGQLYGPPRDGLSLRTYDPDPGGAGFVVASAETLAYAVATGHVGDPRAFKRPARITVPRTLPTEDVLVVRKQRNGKKKIVASERSTPVPRPSEVPWNTPQPLGVVTRLQVPTEPSAFVGHNLQEVGWFARRASSLVPKLRVVVAPFVPSGWTTLFSTCGILSLHATQGQLSRLQRAKALTLTDPEQWQECVPVDVDGETLELRWMATPEERHWALHGTTLPDASRPL